MKRFGVIKLILSLLIPLLIGMIAAALSAKGMATYANMDKPPLSPPAWVFSVAWTILYLMMGLASYLVLMDSDDSNSMATAMVVYAVQLVMNFMWTIFFFNCEAYLVAFIWLIVMLCLVIICAFRFYNISHTAGFLMIPYIAWLLFASYLNMGAYILNRTELKM